MKSSQRALVNINIEKNILATNLEYVVSRSFSVYFLYCRLSLCSQMTRLDHLVPKKENYVIMQTI